jgi:hypothetical protein
MATKSHQKDLIDRLHAGGLRKRAAQTIAEASDGRRKPAKQVRGLLKELNKLVGNAEDQLSRGPAKRKAAARKGAATRKRNAAKHSPAKSAAENGAAKNSAAKNSAAKRSTDAREGDRTSAIS